MYPKSKAIAKYKRGAKIQKKGPPPPLCSAVCRLSLDDNEGSSNHSDNESDDTATSGKCRLSHKFSSDSLFLFYEQQQSQQQQQENNFEDRGEQEDDSDRKMTDASGRSFSIRKASAMGDENEYDDDNYYYQNSYYESRQLFIPDRRPSRPTIHRHPPSDLYLPTF